MQDYKVRKWEWWLPHSSLLCLEIICSFTVRHKVSTTFREDTPGNKKFTVQVILVVLLNEWRREVNVMCVAKESQCVYVCTYAYIHTYVCVHLFILGFRCSDWIPDEHTGRGGTKWDRHRGLITNPSPIIEASVVGVWATHGNPRGDYGPLGESGSWKRAAHILKGIGQERMAKTLPPFYNLSLALS